MEDCCAVCAEPLEWLAYGPCGHREVCSTCTARLRFILDDKCCCICKQECPTVFVTKALGDYTKSIKDFSILPASANEGKFGDYWLHSDTLAYFDDEVHYKMVKAMCRLSCSVCEGNSPGNELQKRDREFKHIDQLKRHLYHVHKLNMCNLCLEGRKVFIGEQKLYNRAQLDRHLLKGDSEVDGSEIERGGFMGHPICDFCRKRFYGDNELYMHMQTEHYTCHICQRRNPGHYDYYRNYNDLEAHFSQEHFLCENPDCLSKKFIVFLSESELKRHNAIEHSGNMSRSQRNAALQIPVSFQYRRLGDERESHRGNRGRGRGRNMNDRLSAANFSTIEMVNLENAIHESMLTATDQNVGCSVNPDPTPSFPPSDVIPNSSTSTLPNEPPRYLTAVSQRALNSSLEESAFPPLPGVSENVGQNSNSKGKKSSKSMAAALRGMKGNVRILNAAQSRQSVGLALPSSSQAVSSFVNQRIIHQNMNHLERSVITNISGVHPRLSTIPNGREMVQNLNEFPPISGRHNVPVVSGTENHLERPAVPNTSGVHLRHSTIANGKKIVPKSDEFPPIQGGQNVPIVSGIENQSTGTSFVPLSSEETLAANKALIESIRSGLGGDAQQFAAFKDLSAQFRNGSINAQKYHTHILQFGLSHLVLELAMLCPDKDKQRELLEANNRVMKNSQHAVNQITSQITGTAITSSNVDKCRKGKSVDVGCSEDATSSSTSDIACCAGNASNEVEVLSRDGYRTAKGKSKPWETQDFNKVSVSSGSSSERADYLQRPPSLPDNVNSSYRENWSCNVCTLLNRPDSVLCLVCGSERPHGTTKELSHGGKEKQKKKITNSQRVSLADFSTRKNIQNSPVGSVWGNGGGQRLLSTVQSGTLSDLANNSKR